MGNKTNKKDSELEAKERVKNLKHVVATDTMKPGLTIIGLTDIILLHGPVTQQALEAYCPEGVNAYMSTEERGGYMDDDRCRVFGYSALQFYNIKGL